ncbi:MAG: PRC-barrel domain-containing protein [Gammaproteobacteria bacterium]|nr:PRC-barrel domain-containing protein [Gammaproteobacteria bacterium]
MKKLHSFTFYALVTPIITLGAGSLLAEQPTDQDSNRMLQSTQQDQSHMQQRGYLRSIPANGWQASKLIGAEVKTTKGDEVGSVNDLIIDEKGQVAAIVVGVGGFLGMGEKDVAIGWGDVTKSSKTGKSDKDELQINLTRESLMSAPEFKRAD